MPRFPRTFLVALLLPAVLALACNEATTHARPPHVTHVHRPATWSALQATTEWSPAESAFLDDALYLLHESLPATDARRALLRALRYRPQRTAAGDVDPWPAGSTGVYSITTRTIYLADLARTDLVFLVATLAHELHHAELDTTPSVNRMHVVDRERAAHAREAEDLGRVLDLLRTRSLGNEALHHEAERAHRVARANAAQYTLKFELFRLLQALGEHDLPPSFADTHAFLLDVAESDLAKDVVRERWVLQELGQALEGAELAPAVGAAFERAKTELRVAEKRLRQLEGRSDG